MRKAAAGKSNKQSESHQVFKRSPLQSLAAVAEVTLWAYISDESVWIVVPEQCARTLHDYGLGSIDGGPATAIQTADKVSQLTGTLADATNALVSLHLSPEETIFLAHATGNLHFVCESVGVRSLQDAWHFFVKCSSSFVFRYIAYHHYRSKGWIPRSGLQYGTDLVLYEQHPSLVHSSLCVIIVPTAPAPADESQQSPQGTSTQASLAGLDGDLSWHDVEGIDRLCIRVGKKLVLLYVQPQRHNLDMTGPACLDSFAVSEHSVDRWVPEASINLM